MASLDDRARRMVSRASATGPALIPSIPGSYPQSRTLRLARRYPTGRSTGFGWPVSDRDPEGGEAVVDLADYEADGGHPGSRATIARCINCWTAARNCIRTRQRSNCRPVAHDNEDLTTGPGTKLVEIIDARIPDRLPALPGRPPQAHPAFQLHRAHLRRDPPPGQGHRPVPGETSCLTLVWAVLDRASAGWRGLTMNSNGLRLLQDLRRSLLEPPHQLRQGTSKPSQPDSPAETVSTVA
jgi:hypothetical protein